MADASEESRTGAAELSNMPEETRVRRVAYCGICSMPCEYCEFGADYKACKTWFAENWRDVLPGEEARGYLEGREPRGEAEEESEGGAGSLTELTPVELVALMTKLGLDGELDDHAKRSQKAGKKTASEEPAPALAPAAADADGGKAGEAACSEPASEGGGGGETKKGKKPARSVVIEVTTRNKKKHITTVKGLESYDVDLGAAAKGFGKKFACGCALQKGKNGIPDQIEIQGDAADGLPSFIADRHKVPLEEIFVVVDGKKVKSTEVPEKA